ncbi:MAG TPA: hypothetical protein VGK59_07685 [Ohtaekwangia sp.]
MKLTKIITCVTLLSAAVLTCSGQASEKVTVQDLGYGIFKLVYISNAPGSVKVSIANTKGETIFQETIPKTASFARPYNFNDQGTGEYKITVEDKDGKTEKKIAYTIKKVESLVDVFPIANTPNKYLLSVENKESDQIQVKILDTSNNLLHEESINVNGKFSVVYNLKVKTKPTFEVTGSSGNTKTFTFE